MKSRSSEIRRARPLLGTLVEIGAGSAQAENAIEAAFREIEAVHRLMSFHDNRTDIARINRAAPREVLRVDPRTYEVLVCSRMISRLSAGAFDITIAGRLVDAGLLPAPKDAPPFDPQASFKDLLLLPDDCVSPRRRLWIDLGGIAKGYAVDRAVQALQKNGVASGSVNAGGDLYILGDAQPIAVRHPQDPSILLRLGSIANAAAASSSGFYTTTQDSDALVDPRRGACVRWRHGITVLARSCMLADALTKVVRLTPRRAPNVLERLGAQAVIVDRRGIRLCAPKNGAANLSLPTEVIAAAGGEGRSFTTGGSIYV